MKVSLFQKGEGRTTRASCAARGDYARAKSMKNDGGRNSTSKMGNAKRERLAILAVQRGVKSYIRLDRY